ncbi:arsenate reductase (glutaredoxin) [Glaciimonas sp. PAMC28666]|nr:arsenate reductase (glutaredoxin) [Glaciimonas sp. PAMC28666]
MVEKLCARSDLLLEIIHYQQVPLTIPMLIKLQKQLDLPIVGMMRTYESQYSKMKLSNASDFRLLQTLIEHPKLLKRPIVAYQNFAVIAQPAELIEVLFCAPKDRAAKTQEIIERLTPVEARPC